MNIKNFDVITYCSLICFLSLIINPIYLLPIIVVLRPLAKNLYIVISDIIIISSFSLLFSSRTYGVNWGVANDDAIVYIQIFKDFYDYGFNNYKNINITGNIEFIFYIYTHFLSIISSGNESFFKFFSIFLPLTIFYCALMKLSRFNSIIILSLMLIMLNQFIHLIFHVWRSSLGSSIIALGFANFITGRKYSYLIVLSIMSHISIIYHATLIFFSSFPTKNNSKFLYILFFLLPILFFYLITLVANFLPLGDRHVYFDNPEYFSFQNSYFLYFILVALIWNQLNSYFLKFFSLTILGTLSLPVFFPLYATMTTRFIESLIPLLFLVFSTTKFFNNKIFLFLLSIFSISYLFKTSFSGDFVTNFIAYGNYLNFYSGFIVAIFY